MRVISIADFGLRIKGVAVALNPQSAIRNPQSRESAIRNPGGIFRHSAWDALLIILALAHGALLLAWPSIPLIAVALWWNANTISHNFIHLPFFRSRALNKLFSWYLTVLLGIPQTLWRERHLAHHGGHGARRKLSPAIAAELALVLGAWSALGALASTFFFTVYLPGYFVGLGLCYLQGHYEHARGTTSHYGSLYNLTFFNDGYHVEHHERSGEHWRYLPGRVRYGLPASPWPPVLRWLEVVNLELLERLVVRSRTLQGFVLRTHERAFVALLPQLGDAREIAIVGGGMFPRTALILQRLFPRARITIIDASSRNLETARYFLNGDVSFVHRHFDAGDHEKNADLVVIPLSFTGNRAAIYANPPARAVLVHDWIWKRHEIGAPVSRFLLKRLNLVKR